jgi:hypothetical protein
MKKPDLVTGIIGTAVSLAVLYGIVYLAGKAWRKSQS